jgi:phage FluMu gp28-like protein
MASQPKSVPAIKLYGYQKKWLADKSRFKLGMFARQTGKTFTTTLEIVDDAFEAEVNERRTRWVILSRGERQSVEAMEEGVMRHVRALGKGLSGAKESTFDFIEDDGGVKIRRTALEITFPHGTRVTALPANPDTARGFSANVFLDEFAFHKDSRKIWQSLFPVISAGFKLRVTSTPNGKGNKFYDLATKDDPKFPWSRHIVDIHQAVEQGLPRGIDELRAALDDEDAWAQEFELQWMDEATAWLSYDLINAVESDQAGLPQLYARGLCFVGVDIAARNDLFVIWVCELIGDVLWTREIIVRKRITFFEQDQLLDDVFARYMVVRCCMDQTGMGEKPVEDAQRRHGTHRVEGVLFTGSNKTVLATTGKQRFEDRQIRIPMGDNALRNDLHKLKKEPSLVGGAPRFVADSDSAGHADRTWACFLACHAAGSDRVPIEFQALGDVRTGVGVSEYQLPD